MPAGQQLGVRIGANDLVEADLTGARFDDRTVWPSNIDPVAAGAMVVGLKDELSQENTDNASTPADNDHQYFVARVNRPVSLRATPSYRDAIVENVQPATRSYDSQWLLVQDERNGTDGAEWLRVLSPLGQANWAPRSSFFVATRSTFLRIDLSDLSAALVRNGAEETSYRISHGGRGPSTPVGVFGLDELAGVPRDLQPNVGRRVALLTGPAWVPEDEAAAYTRFALIGARRLSGNRPCFCVRFRDEDLGENR